MGINQRNPLSFLLVGILIITMIIPVYAQVESVQTNSLFYKKGDKVTFSGTVDYDATGLVTVVIRDPNDKFVLLTQALIQPDNTFERSVDTNEKFSVPGIYNATAFIVNMTEGALTRFDYSIDGSQVIPSVSNLQDKPKEPAQVKEPQTIVTSAPEPEPEPVSKIASFVDPTKDPKYYLDRYNNEPAYKDWFDRNFPGQTIEEAVGIPILEQEIKQNSQIPGFPDPTKDPQYYITRYNNEPAYKDWFDRNFPGQTIYDIVGVPVPESTKSNIMNSTTKEILEANQEISSIVVESSTVSPSIDSGNNELAQMLLALGGLGVLFGAVYGVKRKVDKNSEQITANKTILQKKVENNSDQISQNRFWLKKKIMNLKSNDEPIKVIKDRLAKGEITVDEYYKLLRALKK